MKQKKVKEEKTLKLNLASGDNPVEGFLNVDIAKTPTVDKVVNLEKLTAMDDDIHPDGFEYIPVPQEVMELQYYNSFR